MSHRIMEVESFHSPTISGEKYTYVARYSIKGDQVLWIASVKRDMAAWEIHGQVDVPEDIERDAAAAVQSSVNRQIDAF